MAKTKLVYIWSLRNAAADKAGQSISYKGALRYMKSPLEYLVEALQSSELGRAYSLEAVIFDDDKGNALDCEKIKDYGFSYRAGCQWFYPPDLEVGGRRVNDLLCGIPSTYRRLLWILLIVQRPRGRSKPACRTSCCRSEQNLSCWMDCWSS